MTARLSFLILTHGRPDWARACVESLAAGIPQGVEAVVAFNGDEPGLDASAAAVSAGRPWVRVEKLARINRAEARNKLAELAAGEILYFLDDDTTVPAGFAARVLEAFGRHPDAPVVAGPNVAPPDSSPFERAVDHLLGSWLGAGPMRVRFKALGAERPLPGWCFTLCNLGVRRDVFTRHGFSFPPGCISAEENLFLHRVERKLGLPIYSPTLQVYHRRRNSLAAWARQVFGYGQGRMQITRREPRSMQLVVLGPPALLALLAAGAWLPRVSVATAAAYAAAVLLETTLLALKDPAAALRLPAAAIVGHAAYAAGLVAGLFLR